MLFRPAVPFLFAAFLATSFILPASAEYHVIVTHRSMLDIKSWSMMTYEQFRQEQKLIDLERRLMEEAQIEFDEIPGIRKAVRLELALND